MCIKRRPWLPCEPLPSQWLPGEGDPGDSLAMGSISTIYPHRENSFLSTTVEFPTRMWLFFVVIPWTVYRELCSIIWFIVNSLGMKICMVCVKVLQCFICQTLNVWGVLLGWGRGFPEAILPRFWRTAPHSAFWTSRYYITSQILFIRFPKSGVGGFV